MSGVERRSSVDADDPFAVPFQAPPIAGPSRELAGGDVGGPDLVDSVVDEADSDDEHPLDVEKVRRYQRLRDAEKAADTEREALKEEADKLQAELISMFASNGLQNLNVDGRTVYLHRSVYAQRKEGVTAEDVIAALIADGEGDLVKPTVNGNTLSAWVRELTEDDDAAGLPEHAAEVLEPGERYSVRIIAGGTKAKSKTHSK